MSMGAVELENSSLDAARVRTCESHILARARTSRARANVSCETKYLLASFASSRGMTRASREASEGAPVSIRNRAAARDRPSSRAA